jgi:hypothetical protein
MNVSRLFLTLLSPGLFFLFLLLHLDPDGEVSRVVGAVNTITMHEFLVAVTPPGADST